MAATNIKGGRVADGTITRDDLNDTTTTKAVTKRVTAQNGVRIASSSGVDAGTGDVVLEADLTYLNTKYPSLLTSQSQNSVLAAPSSSAGNPTFRTLVAGDIPPLTIAGVTGLQVAIDSKVTVGGDTLGAGLIIGTLDAYNVTLKRGGTTQATLRADGIGDVLHLAVGRSSGFGNTAWEGLALFGGNVVVGGLNSPAQASYDLNFVAHTTNDNANNGTRKSRIKFGYYSSFDFANKYKRAIEYSRANDNLVIGTYSSAITDLQVISGTAELVSMTEASSVYFASNGNVSIGQADNEGLKLLVNGNSKIKGYLEVTQNISTVDLYLSGSLFDYVLESGEANQFLHATGDGKFRWTTVDIEDIYDLQNQLDLKFDASDIDTSVLWNTTGNNTTSDLGFNLLGVSELAYNFLWSVNNSEKMRLTAQGNLGVGIDPEAVIHGHATVVGAAEVVMLKASNETTSNYFSIAIDASNARTKFYAGGEIWANTVSKWKFGAADISGIFAFSVAPTMSVDATNGNQLVRLSQVQSLVSSGFAVSTVCVLVFTTNQTLSSAKTQGGYTTVTNDYALFQAQTTGGQNGIYKFDGTNWNRATENDTDAEIRGKGHLITKGTFANTQWVNTNSSTITVGTTAIIYTQWSGAETDPVWVAFRDSNSITPTTVSNWNDAYTNKFTNAKAIAAVLTGYAKGSNTALSSSDTIIGAIAKLEGKVDSKAPILSGTANYISKFTSSTVIGNSIIYANSVSVGIGTITPNAAYKLDVTGDINITGKIFINGTFGADHTFLKSNGTEQEFTELNTGELQDKLDILMYSVQNTERVVQLFSDTLNETPEGYLGSNPDAGIGLKMMAYTFLNDDLSSVKEFGIELNRKDGNLYQSFIDGTTARILTTKDNVGGGTWSGGRVSNDIKVGSGLSIYFGSYSGQDEPNQNQFFGKIGGGLTASNVFGGYVQALVIEAGNSNNNCDLMMGSLRNVYIKGEKIFFNGIEIDMSTFANNRYLRATSSTKAEWII